MKKSKYLVYILFLLIPLSNGCKDKETLPTVTTSDISEIKTDLTSISASGGGNISNDGSDAVIARGVCWNTTEDPTTENSKTTDGSGLGSFTSTLTGLSSGETYYVRAYATNSAGTSYGDEVSFTTAAWAKYTGNPVLVRGSAGTWDQEIAGFGSVIYYNNKYHMWYTGGKWVAPSWHWRIGHATSDDGINWTKDANNPVLVQGSPGSWEDDMVNFPRVLVKDNVFHMWYSGHKGTNYNRNNNIGHATSADGSTWTKDPNNPVLTTGAAGTWENSWICTGDVLFDGTKYHMWYSGCDTISKKVMIGHATSTDALTWTKDPANPVFVAGGLVTWEKKRVELPSVLFDGVKYHMWYSGGDLFNWNIGYATSTDGITWTKDPGNPVLIPNPSGTWDTHSVAVMSVLSSGAKYKMWYSGSALYVSTWVGYAEKPKE